MEISRGDVLAFFLFFAAARTAYGASATVGNNSASWNPTIIVNVPAQAIAGDYSGTITHSVA